MLRIIPEHLNKDIKVLCSNGGTFEGKIRKVHRLFFFFGPVVGLTLQKISTTYIREEVIILVQTSTGETQKPKIELIPADAAAQAALQRSRQ